MKTTVYCATLLCLELVSSFPFPEPLQSYYGSYKPVGVPEQRVISQPIQIPNLAHSQNSAYQQQQLAYLQQENLRRQNYDNLLRNQEQQQLNQRIASQLLNPPQPAHNYNIPLPLNTVREPYMSSSPLQRPRQPQYEAPITQQYYQNQQFTEPYQRIEPPQQIQVQNPKPQPIAKPVSPAQNYQYNQQHQPVPQHKAQNALYNPRIQQALATTPLKKRYLVLHPNGTVEHIDKIENIVKRYPNYILVNAGDLPKPNETVTPGAVQPVAPLDPGVVANEKSEPVAPVAPLTPVVPPTPGVKSLLPTTSSSPKSLSPTVLNGTVPGVKPTVPPPTGPTTTSKSVTAPIAFPPQPLSTTFAPLDPGTTTPLPPTSTANPTVTPPDDSISTTPSVTTETPTKTPSVVTATATVAYPPPFDAISTTPTPTTNTDPTVTPPSVTETATAEYPPTPTPEVTTEVTTEETAEVTTEETAEVTTEETAEESTELTTENSVTPAPVANSTTIDADSQSPEATTSTNVKSEENQSDANATITKSTELTRPDLPFSNIPTNPIVWFRSTDINFFDKLTSGNETFDIVYFFNIPRESRVFKDTKTTIHANGTVVEEITETIYDDEDAPPRIVKTTKVTNPDDSQPNT